jgi:hypothetical protein
MKRNREKLQRAASDALWSAGFKLRNSYDEKGKHECLVRIGTEWFTFEVQGRSFNEKNDEYRLWVGVSRRFMAKVQKLVVWFEGKPKFYVLDCSWLKDVHERYRRLGQTSYVHARDTQWSVAFRLDSDEIEIHGAGGQRERIPKGCVFGQLT